MPGLTISRREGERVQIGEPPNALWVTVRRIQDGRVMLNFDGPRGIHVLREEAALREPRA